MAEYFCKYSNNVKSNNVSSIQLLDELIRFAANPIMEIYAIGTDIDFKLLFALNNPYSSIFIIVDTDFDNLELHSLPNNLTLKNCKVFGSLSILNIESYIRLTLNECQINECKIDSCSNLSELKVLDCNNVQLLTLINIKEINSIIVKRSTLSSFTITSTDKIINPSNILQTVFCTIGYIYFSLSNVSFYANKLTLTKGFRVSICKNSVFAFRDCSFKCNSVLLYNNDNSDFRFMNITITENTNISISEGNSNLYFNHCIFLDEIHFIDILDSINDNNITISNSVFKEIILFTEELAKLLKLRNNLFQKGISLPIENQNNNKDVHSSVWCALKNQALQNNDRIIALNYRKNEMEAYSKEIRKSGTFQDKVVLYLNSWSNAHGLRWDRGILFTLSTCLFFFSFYYWAANNFNIIFNFRNLIFLYKDFWNEAVQFLWLPSGIGTLPTYMETELNGFSLFILVFTFLLGKIFIGYGIFQTISAFRKHGKV